MDDSVLRIVKKAKTMTMSTPMKATPRKEAKKCMTETPSKKTKSTMMGTPTKSTTMETPTKQKKPMETPKKETKSTMEKTPKTTTPSSSSTAWLTMKDDSQQAPHRVAFLEALRLIEAGLAHKGLKRQVKDTSTGVGRTKMRCMKWCLYEAKKQHLQDIVGKSVKMSINQDVKNGMLLCRFACVDSKLRVTCGTLGLRIGFGTGSIPVRDATLDIVRRFCTKGYGRPRGLGTAVGTTTYKLLLEKVKRNIVLFNADGGSDEQKAGLMLKPSSLEMVRNCDKHLYQGALPNLIVVARDKPHAMRRVIKRPWTADGYLWNIYNAFIVGPKAFAAVVEFSPEIKTWFERNVKATTNNNIKSLCFAKHRFNSTQKPMGRFCLYLQASITTLVQIFERRWPEPEAVAAKQMLVLMSDDGESLLTCAMMADCGDEFDKVLRFMDSENMEVADFKTEVQNYIDRIHVLFVLGDVCKTPGYTLHVLQELAEQRCVVIDGVAKTIGGQVLQVAIDNCLNRMKNYVRLAKLTVEAEFPAYDVCNAMSVLSLDRKSSWRDNNRADHVERLCVTLKLDKQRLHDEIADFHPVVSSLSQSEDLSVKDAWSKAMQVHWRRPAVGRAMHPCDELQKLLEYHAVWVASSSGVEQSLSKDDSKHRKCRSEASKSIDMQLVCDPIEDPKVRQSVASRAVQIWQVGVGSRLSHVLKKRGLSLMSVLVLVVL